MRSFYFSLIKQRKFILIFFALLVAIAAYSTKDLKIILDTDKLLPPNHEYTKGSRQISAEFGLKYTVVIGITKKDLTTLTVQDIYQVRKASRRLVNTEGVLSSTVSLLTSSRSKVLVPTADGVAIEPIFNPALSVGEMLERSNADPFFERLLLSQDQKVMFIALDTQSPGDGFRALQERILTAFEDLSAYEIKMTGFVPMMAAIEHYSDRVALLLVVSFLIISFLLKFFLNSLQAAIVPLLTGVSAIVISLGLMGYLGIPIDVFNAVTPILILAVICGHSTQIMCAYIEELKRLRDTKRIEMTPEHEALVNTMCQLFPTLIAAGAAASLGFMSLMVFEIQSIKTFGLLVGVSIGIGVVLELIFVPALRAFFPEPEVTKDSLLTSKLRAGSVQIGRYGLSRPKGVIVVTIGLLVAFGLFATQIRVENSNKANISQSEKIQQDDIFLNDAFPGTNTLYVMFDTGAVDGVKQLEFLTLLDRLGKRLSTDTSVGRSISYADHARRINKAFNPEADLGLPESETELIDQLNFYELGTSPSDLAQFVSNQYSRSLLIILLKDDSSSTVARLRGVVEDEIARSVMSNSLKVVYGGSVAEAAAITDQLVIDKSLNILQVLAVVLVIALLVFRSFLLAFLVVLPSVISVLFNFAFMVIFDIPLNIPTSICAAMVVGLGADYSIYFLMKAKQLSSDVSLSRKEVLEKVINSAGFVCFTVSILIVCGYSTMLLSYQFLPHQWIAMLVISSMIVSALVTVLVLPAFLITFQAKLTRGTSKQFQNE